jgi:hypothetical protein
MSRILFQPDLPITAPDPGRADVACFVGLVRISASIVPDSAHKVAADGTLTDVALKDIHEQDTVQVNPGEAIPVDGVVIRGSSLVDESTVTGAAGLLQKGGASGDTAVLAGTRNVSGTLTIRASENGGPVAPLPQPKRDWLKERGWSVGPYKRDCDALYDVPIPIENFAGFKAIYDDGTSHEAVGTDYLAVAVQSFFAQGGKHCYVVRMGDPLGLSVSADERANLVATLLASNANAQDQGSWHGIAHLWGLPDVSFLLLPDLPALHASTVKPAKGTPVEMPSGPEQFVPCVPETSPPEEKSFRAFPAPRFAPDAYTEWGKTLHTIVQVLSNAPLREVQFVAAMPLPLDATASPVLESTTSAQTGSVHDAINAVLPEVGIESSKSSSSSFLQLAYPWLRTTRSQVLLEGLEPPDGSLAGLLARNALLQGTFNSATKIVPLDIIDAVPALPAFETAVAEGQPLWNRGTIKPLIVRLSLFGFTPAGIRLLSDVTAYPGEAYRPGRVNRLVSVICRNARHFGESHVFEDNGPRLWAQLEQTLRQFLMRLWTLGALDGATPSEAFEVHCDRNTMTQNDVDNGRLIATVSFRAAAVIELIQVTLTIEAGGATQAEVGAQLIGAA